MAPCSGRACTPVRRPACHIPGAVSPPAIGAMSGCPMEHQLSDILDKAIAGRRLDRAEGLALLRSHDLAALGARRTPSPAACTPSRSAPTTSTATSTTRTSAPAAAASALLAQAGRRGRLRHLARRVAPQDRGNRRAGRQSDSVAGRAAPRAADRVVRGVARRHQAAFPPVRTSTVSARPRSITSRRSPGCRCGRCWSG